MKRTRKAAALTHSYAFVSVLVGLEDKQALSGDDVAWLESATTELDRASKQLGALEARIMTLKSYPRIRQRKPKPEKPVVEQLKDVLVSGEHVMKSGLM